MLLRYTLAALLLLAAPAAAQTPGSCDLGTARAELSLSDVRAEIYNTGALFWNRGLDNVFYEVPKDGGVTAIFTAGLWLGGEVNGEVRTVWSDYGERELWPGPLNDGATLPNPSDCSAYDRIYRATAPELAAYEQTGVPTASLAGWPVGLGAPAVDASGVAIVPTSREQTVDQDAGERPVIYGSETLFWVMNDVGNVHVNSAAPPLGVEVRATAFSVNDPDETVLDQSTFYRFEIVNRSTATIEDFRAGFWTDFVLGDFNDDYVGSDVERSMFYVYNSDNDDNDYGPAPPAVGVDLLAGAYGAHSYKGSGVNTDEPNNATGAYNYLSGLWEDGTPMTRSGFGYDPGSTDDVVTWQFDGDPTATDVYYWSELDLDLAPGQQPSDPGDRRGILSAMPVDLAPGASHTMDVAIVFARGADVLDSVTELRAASDLVQARYDDGSLFETTSGDLGLPPLAAATLVSPADGTAFMPPESVLLDWELVADADRYRVEYSARPDFVGATRQAVTAPPVEVDFLALPEGSFEPIYWRVTPLNANGEGPSSESRSFTYGFEFEAGVETLSNGQSAFLEVAGPGGADPCGDAAGSTFGCAEAGGNAIYVPFGDETPDANGTGAYGVTSLGGGPEGSLTGFAPNDFEIRFTADGSIAYHLFTDGPGKETHRVPFEVWDIGIVPLGADGVPGVNDPSDDRQMVPIMFSDGGAGLCRFQFGQISATDPNNSLGAALTDRIYAYYPTSTYADFDAVAAPLVDAAADGCYDDSADGVLPGLIDTGRGRPIQRVVFADLAGSGSVADLQGAVVRFHTTNPEPVADEAAPTASALALTVAPNPSRGAARVSFALPTAGAVRVRVVDVLGREVAVLADGVRAAGPHVVAMPRGLSAGVYVVTVEAGAERAVRTLTVVR